MTRPTITRTELRRAIAMRLMMPFARRVALGYADLTAATASTVSDTVNLAQPLDYWAGQWLYLPATNDVRRIVRSTTITKQLSLEYGISPTPSVGADYEIHSIFNAHEIHQAINDAIRTAYPAFFDTREDKSIIVQEEKLEYDISTITPAIGIIHEVAIERPSTRMMGMLVSDSYNAGTDIDTLQLESTADLSDVTTTWYISIYKGSGEGKVYPILTINNTLKQVTVSDATDPGLDNTSKYVLWNARDQLLDWYRVKEVHFSSKEWPGLLRFYAPIYSYRGSRIRIKYSTAPTVLTAESSTTPVPAEYIISKAISILAKTRLGDNRVDRQRYAVMEESYNREAEEFKERNFFRLPDIELWMEGNDSRSMGDNDPLGNPMGWR